MSILDAIPQGHPRFLLRLGISLVWALPIGLDWLVSASPALALQCVWFFYVGAVGLK